MEHRIHRREPVDLMVKLINRGSVVAIVRAIDISSGGMRVETPGLKLNSGEGVAVDFCLSGYPRGPRCCLNAMVIHSGVEATGLMMSSQTSLRDVLSESSIMADNAPHQNRQRL